MTNKRVSREEAQNALLSSHQTDLALGMHVDSIVTRIIGDYLLRLDENERLAGRVEHLEAVLTNIAEHKHPEPFGSRYAREMLAPHAAPDVVYDSSLPAYLTEPWGAECSSCRRKGHANEVGVLCRMTQPDGSICPGVFVALPHAAPGKTKGVQG